ncbi:2'-5' RNA ligase family protein [Limosilactobacillus mucosae]|uniref:2'-5' RNA ligase family protein n=1 Tax=Limosilactobacillus mucosae TaxID=97478 RepID=UPI003996BDF0
MKKELDSLYRSIDQKGKAAILKNQFADPYLCRLKPDSRLGLTLLARLPVHVGRNIGYAQQKLRTANPNLYCYPLADLHLNVLNLIEARTDFSLAPADLAAYQNSIKELLANCRPFSVMLQGLIASPSGILTVGYYSDELFELRKALRLKLAKDLPLVDHYQTASGHVTIARFEAPLNDPNGLLCDLDEMGQLRFGSFVVKQVDLVIADWYNHDVKVIDEYALAALS